MSHERLVLASSITFALLASAAAPAAVISSNNTGSMSPIIILDWDGGASDPGVSDSGGGGTDDDSGDRGYGSLGRWAPSTESTTYEFTGLAEGNYRIFATWLHDFPRAANGFVVANGSFVGTYDGVDTETDIGGIDISQGFIAQKDTTVDPSGSPFEYVGDGTVGPFDSTLIVIVTSSSSDDFRTDAIAIQYIPEATNLALAALAPLALLGFTRRRRRTAR